MTENKPEKKYPLKMMYIYQECVDFINQKYNVDINDYYGYRINREKEHFDFDHYVSDYCYNNGIVTFCSQTVHRLKKSESDEYFTLVAQIMEWFLKEFGEEKEFFDGQFYTEFEAYSN